MKICEKCYVVMRNVLSFSQNGNKRFSKCPKCGKETKYILVKNSELDLKRIKKIKGEVYYDNRRNDFK